MKIIKPQYAFRTAINFDGVELLTGGAEVMSFLRSLPAEFEIVEPGMTQVRWPRMLTRQCLLDQAVMIGNAGFNGTASDLHELAAIAPEEKKKRKVALWRHDSWPKDRMPDVYPNGAILFGMVGWRKVGECEVDT